MKWKCENCGAVRDNEELLSAPHPFKPGLEIDGCPACREVGMITAACDENGCTEAACMGTPTETGYRHFCSKHRPEFDGEHDPEPTHD